MPDQDAPSPGSDAAVQAGCTCPVLDNARGQGWMCGGEFWIDDSCPLHALKAPIWIALHRQGGEELTAPPGTLDPAAGASPSHDCRDSINPGA